MDPNATLTRFCAAMRAQDYPDAMDAATDLLRWLDRGGFPPDWPDDWTAHALSDGESLDRLIGEAQWAAPGRTVDDPIADLRTVREILRRYAITDIWSLDDMARAYLECALWTAMDDDGDPLDERYTLADADPETLLHAATVCGRFHDAHVDAIDGDTAQAGYDLWLTRNGHGSGFWDGDWPEPAASILTAAAEALGECDVFADCDGATWFVQSW